MVVLGKVCILMSEVPLQSPNDARPIAIIRITTAGSVMYKHETHSTRAQGLCMNPPPPATPSSCPDSLELLVPTGGFVGLALKVNRSQVRHPFDEKRSLCTPRGEVASHPSARFATCASTDGRSHRRTQTAASRQRGTAPTKYKSPLRSTQCRSLRRSTARSRCSAAP